eukprot:JP446667.1.p1 GENE.JP446667.1~~JP446667.1.p1  ORF type:complete len:219 (-),score=44.47 JP446667.1:279-866(-)
MVALALVHACCASILQFEVQPNSKRCISQDVEKHTLMVLNYESSLNPGVHVSIKDPEMMEFHRANDIQSGKHGFSSHQVGLYEYCFENTRMSSEEIARIKFDLKTGVDAKDYSEVIKVKHLKPMDLELLQMIDHLDAINKDFEYVQAREEAMRNTNESSNFRAQWFSVASIVWLICMGVWQTWHLMNFFRSKKIF